MWIVIHSLIWNGKVSNLQDITTSLLSPGMYYEVFYFSNIFYFPGQTVPLSNPTSVSSRLSLDSLSELSFVKLWNFFTDPNPSTRNLFLNIGFVSFSD